MITHKMDDLSLISNDSNHSNSNSTDNIASQLTQPGVSALKNKKMKKPRRLVYDPTGVVNAERNASASDPISKTTAATTTTGTSTIATITTADSDLHSFSKLVGQPRPAVPPPKPPPVLSPIQDAPESEERATSTRTTNFTFNLNDHADPVCPSTTNSQDHPNPISLVKNDSISLLLEEEAQISTPRNIDPSEEQNPSTTRNVGVPSVASTPTLSGVDSQFEWGSRSPRR
ncbi:SET domain-containing protein [Reticulomyxa filosa]|uniref:SET domain-containing protein n=1 Tax=Reticulomyxa filosa TaxID=46433 RepID=X6P8V8_RETFI|nr:SET domain-containing protein [Reticulomyxa filosa]|eukprot:ETO34082.1 SET domain-containing protein [Reticulomyxa filosa]